MGRRQRVVLIHSLDHARAALGAARDLGVAVTLLSAPGAGAYAGAGWFAEIEAQARREFPTVEAAFVLDCGDDASAAMAALDRGVRRIAFGAPRRMRDKIADMARQTGVELVRVSGPALDLGTLAARADGLAACREWLDVNR